jgi:hypothetical protein
MRTARSLRLVLGLLALLAAGLLLSGCALFKPGSLKTSQPAGIGSVHVHFELCSTDEGEDGTPCEKPEEEGDGQQLLGFAVPIGATAPATITALPKTAKTPAMTYVRSDQVGAAMASGARYPGPKFVPWQPPPGTQVVGYITQTLHEGPGDLREWTVDADFGLPAAADGGSNGVPYPVTVASGWRAVSDKDGIPASRPVDCKEFEGTPEAPLSQCFVNEALNQGVSDLKVQPPAAAATAFPGGQGAISFGLDFASSAASAPSFGLTGGTSLPGGSVSLSDRVYIPGPVGGAAFRAALASRQLTVAVPVGATPGTYDVVLSATTTGGGTATGVAKLQVIEAKVKLVGKPKLRPRAGTAVLTVAVPGAGTLTASGAGVVAAKKTANQAQRLKLTIKAKGGAKKALTSTGKAKLKLKLKFQPSSGAATTRSASLTLKLR